MNRSTLHWFAATPVLIVAGLGWMLFTLLEDQCRHLNRWFEDGYAQTARWTKRGKR